MSEPGRDAYRGFEYQIHGTAWLLLHHLFRRGIESTACIEPLSGQDVELAKRDTPEPAEGRSVRVDLSDGETWIIQIKTRRGRLWSGRDLEAIFTGTATTRKTKRPARFPPPAELLEKDPSARFLFVTDGALARAVCGLASDDGSWVASERGGDAALPETIAKYKGRVAVLHQRAFRHIARDASVILADELGMSSAAAQKCFRALVERVREALLDERRGAISARELRELAAGHRLVVGEGPNGFVAPSCWNAVQDQLERDHAIVLVGEAGAGKSFAAAELVRLHGKTRPPFEQERFTTRDDPKRFERFWAPADLTRRVAWVDDPFGRDEVARLDDLTAWARALENAQGTADRLLIVTTRLTFLREVEELLPKLRKRVFDFDAPFAPAQRRVLLAAKVAGQQGLSEGERGELLSQSERITGRLQRAISIDLLPTKYLEHRGAPTLRERLELAIVDADAAAMGRDVGAFFEGQRDPIRRGAYASGWLLELGASAERLEQLMTVVGQDLGSAHVEVDLARAIELMRERRWLRRRPEARAEALHPTHLGACRALSRDDSFGAIAIARVMLEGRWEAGDSDTTAALARILLEHPHLGIAPIVEPMRVAARAVVTRRPVAQGFTRALRFLATAGDVVNPLDRAAMALEARVTSDDSRWFMRGFQEWKRPSWSEANYAMVRGNASVQALAHAFVEERITALPMTFVNERGLVDFLYDIADVAPAFLSLLSRIGELGWQSKAPAYGIARATRDFDTLVRHAIEIVRSVESDPDELRDEDNDAEIEHLNERDYERLVPAEQIARAVVRLAPPDFLLGRSEPLLFEHYAKLIGRLPPHDPRRAPDYVRRVVARCPPVALAVLTSELAGQDQTFDLALAALARLPISEWGRVTSDLFERGREDRGHIVVRWLRESFLPRAIARDRGRALAELRIGLPAEELPRLLDGLSPAERDAYLVMVDDPGRSPTSMAALALLVEIVRAPEPHVADPLPFLAAAGVEVRQEIERFARSPHIGPATAALAAAQHLPIEERGALAQVGLAHRFASVRKAAALLAADVQDAVRERLAKIVTADPTPSVRVYAVRALATIADEFALRALERALEDRTDTAAGAGRGFQDDDESDPVFGVAEAARDALEPLDRWPDQLREQPRALAARFDAAHGER